MTRAKASQLLEALAPLMRSMEPAIMGWAVDAAAMVADAEWAERVPNLLREVGCSLKHLRAKQGRRARRTARSDLNRAMGRLAKAALENFPPIAGGTRLPSAKTPMGIKARMEARGYVRATSDEMIHRCGIVGVRVIERGGNYWIPVWAYKTSTVEEMRTLKRMHPISRKAFATMRAAPR